MANSLQNQVSLFFTKAPILFPLIGLFHIGLLLYLSFLWVDTAVAPIYWVRPLIMGLYMVFWIGACYLKKKMANGYLILTIIMVVFYYFFPSDSNHLDSEGFWNTLYHAAVRGHRIFGDILLEPLPVNILFSFVLLLYYRKMGTDPQALKAELKEKAQFLKEQATNDEAKDSNKK